jgi:NADH-quinone oxidoreductase subunit A
VRFSHEPTAHGLPAARRVHRRGARDRAGADGGAVPGGRAQPRPEKVSAYECGFNAFDDAHEVRRALLPGVDLFIIFDLEVAFLFPWAVAFKDVGAFGFWSMMVFLGVLTIGFIYEWRKGALEWIDDGQ